VAWRLAGRPFQRDVIHDGSLGGNGTDASPLTIAGASSGITAFQYTYNGSETNPFDITLPVARGDINYIAIVQQQTVDHQVTFSVDNYRVDKIAVLMSAPAANGDKLSVFIVERTS